MTVVNVHDAKSNPSRLLSDVERGEEIVIARAGKPVARLVPVEVSSKRVFGGFEFSVPDEFFFEPLPEDELARWE